MENNNENAHLNIETVTPDTEKDGQPNDQKNNHRVENEGGKDAGEKSEADKPEGNGEKDPYAVYEKTDAVEDEDSNEEKPTDDDDLESDVETVAP